MLAVSAPLGPPLLLSSPPKHSVGAGHLERALGRNGQILQRLSTLLPPTPTTYLTYKNYKLHPISAFPGFTIRILFVFDIITVHECQTIHTEIACLQPSLLFTMLMMLHVLLTAVMIIMMILQVLLVLSLLSAVSAQEYPKVVMFSLYVK